MLSHFEALLAFARDGTMGLAAARLRLTQSAVSKRIAALEHELGVELVEKRGRRAVLTAEGTRLVARVAPLVAELNAALGEGAAAQRGELTLGGSESILASWGAGALRAVETKLGNVRLALHAHRGPVVVERVAAGEYAVGLVAGAVSASQDLEVIELGEEPMVLIGAARARAGLELITIEARSSTWAALERRFAKRGLIASRRVESFFVAARLALEGFGPALVPFGVAFALRVPRADVGIVPGLGRPIVLIARRSTLARPLVAAFVVLLRTELGRRAKAWKDD